jgi:branched-chain amino acid transport system substrate-binding protein
MAAAKGDVIIMRLTTALLAATAALGLSPAAFAADQIKVGLVTTYSGTEAAYGEMETNGFKLGLAHLGGKLGGLPVTIVTGDDENKTDTAIQQATKMVDRDHVDFITGPALTTTVLGVEKVTREAKIPYLSGGPGPSQFAGRGCEPWFFGVGWQNDAVSEVMGQYMTDQKIPDVYLIAPQIAAGRDMLAGFKRFYKGKVDEEKYTQMTQLDFAAEIADIAAAKPAGVFFFFPSGVAANFIQQWNQAGMKNKIPLYTMNALDQANLPALGEMAIGIPVGVHWAETIDTPQNKKFVADYLATYKKLPSSQAASAYMVAMLVDAAVKSINGKIEDKVAFRNAIRDAKITSLTGEPFKFGPNNMPVENYYVATIEKNAAGADTLANAKVVLADHSDNYVGACKMPAN